MRAPSKENVLRRLDKYITEISKLDDGINTQDIYSLLQKLIQFQSDVEKMTDVDAESCFSEKINELQANQVYLKLIKKACI